MEATTGLLVVAIAWSTIGVAAALFMGRRGHNPFAWLILGAVLGPLCVPVAAVAVFGERPHTKRAAIGLGGHGTVDILVGIDGSPESEAALRHTGTLFGNRLGRLTLATVEDFDTAGSGGAPLSSEVQLAQSLKHMASGFGARRPGAIILSGRPAEALIQHATEEGYELIVIGRRGRGLSKTLLGHTATRLARGSEVPVLIV